MENTHIEWADHTFNPWVGCTQVSPGCKNCYALTLNKRWAGGANWGKGAPRKRTAPANWKQPLKWNRDALDEMTLASFDDMPKPRRPRVFCASLADWLDDEVPIEWLADLLKLIHDTPNLDWLLLTKRPEKFLDRLCAAMQHIDGPWFRGDTVLRSALGDFVGDWIESFHQRLSGATVPDNVWIGTTVENQEMADLRIPQLLAIPAKVRFLSCEPLLSDIDLLGPEYVRFVPSRIHWLICGGESGPGARPMHPDWARSLRDQCQAAGVPFHFKQWGEWLPGAQTDDDSPMPKELTMLALDGTRGNDVTMPQDKRTGMKMMCRIGKRAAGRLLDGREWNEFPKAEVSV